MKLKKWALIAEVVGGVAIVVSLVVLIFEVRGNTEAVRAATFQNVSDSITANGMEIAADPEALRIYLTGLREGLDDLADRDRFQFLMIGQMRRFENAFYQRSRMQPGQWQGLQTALDGIVSNDGFGLWWNDRRLVFSLGFQELVDELRSDDSVDPF